MILTPPVDIRVALIGLERPVVESSQPANSNVLVVLGVNITPFAGITGATASLPAVEPGVPSPIMIWPVLLLIPAIPMLPGFAAVGLNGPGAMNAPVPLMSRMPAAVLG